MTEARIATITGLVLALLGFPTIFAAVDTDMVATDLHVRLVLVASGLVTGLAGIALLNAEVNPRR